MRILVTGHRGYVGSGLFSFFESQKGVDVIGLSSQEGMENLTPKRIKKMGISLIVNCAAVTCRNMSEYKLNSPSDLVNVLFLRKLIEATEISDTPLIHISSKDVYGLVYTSENVTLTKKRFHPISYVDESYKFSPETIYAKSKLISEYLVEGCSRYAVIRLNTIYTSLNHKNGGWISKMCDSIINNQDIILANSGMIFRDPLHVDDLGRLILKIYRLNFWNLKFNVGGGIKNLSGIKEVFDLICLENEKINGIYSGIISFCNSHDYGFAFSNEYATKKFDWLPQKTLSEEMEKIIFLRRRN